MIYKRRFVRITAAIALCAYAWALFLPHWLIIKPSGAVIDMTLVCCFTLLAVVTVITRMFRSSFSDHPREIRFYTRASTFLLIFYLLLFLAGYWAWRDMS